jgi:hypothetical protein
MWEEDKYSNYKTYYDAIRNAMSIPVSYAGREMPEWDISSLYDTMAKLNQDLIETTPTPLSIKNYENISRVNNSIRMYEYDTEYIIQYENYNISMVLSLHRYPAVDGLFALKVRKLIGSSTENTYNPIQYISLDDINDVRRLVWIIRNIAREVESITPINNNPFRYH